MKKRLLIAIFSILSSLAGVAQARSLDFWSKEDPEKLADSLLASLSDEETVAQVIMLGYLGTEPSEEVLDWIGKRGLGGIKVFGWNADDTDVLAESVGRMQEESQKTAMKIPLFIATDQEGGFIRHVKGDASTTPGNMAIGASGYPIDAYESGYYIGRELSALGINMNFAPVVDLATERTNTVIGTRAFSADPMTTAILGAAFFRGLEANGVIATAKHFPGHGDTGKDSHRIMPRIDLDYDTVWERELVPYRLLAKEGIPVVMSGHLSYPKIVPDGSPASLSPFFLKTVLRDRIGFKGIVITDDLIMQGATEMTGAMGKSAVLALMAGNDIVLFSATIEAEGAVFQRLLSTYRNDAVFRESLRSSVRRILALKLDYFKRKEAVPLIPEKRKIADRVPDKKGTDFFISQAARSITAVKADGVPLKPAEGGKILLAGQFSDFFKEGARAYPKASSYRFSYLPAEAALPEEKRELLKQASAADSVVFCLANQASLELLQALRPLKKKVYVISSLSPVYLKDVFWVEASLAAYSYAPESFRAAFSALVGDIPATGTLPMSIE